MVFALLCPGKGFSHADFRNIKLEVNDLASEKVLLQKQQAVADLKAKLEKAVAGVMVDYKGIDVANDTQLRKELREAGIDYCVYKNSIIRFALEGTQYADLAKHLDGTTAFAVSEEDATAAARIIAKYSKAVKEGFNVKAGFVEGKILDVAGVNELAEIPSREVLIARVLGGFNGVIRNFAVVLDQIREQKEAC